MLTVPGIMLAMPNAAGVRSLGDLFLFARAARTDKRYAHNVGLPATHSHLPCGRCLQNRCPGKDCSRSPTMRRH